MTFYDHLLLQLLAAVGAALFVGNLVALVRRRRDHEAVPTRASAGSSDLPEAPVARTLLYMALGLIVMTWGIASLIAA